MDPEIYPKWSPKLIQNGARNVPKMEPKWSGAQNKPKMESEWDPKWIQNGTQNGPKMDPKWSPQ